MKRLLAVASASLILSLGLTACGGGGGSSSSGGGGGLQATGFEVPTEISAVPTNLSGSVGGVSKPAGFRSKLMALKRAATDPGTDYSNAKSTKYVEEHALEQFNIVEDIMKSLEQTHYADATNINQGPYKAMVTQPGNDKGSASKQLEPWTVDSKMTTENGKDVNVVNVWITETRDGGQQNIRAQFKIYASATKKADGSYQDYGVWTLNASLGTGSGESFTADASVGANGEAIVKIHSIESHGGGVLTDTEGILNKSDTSGFGKVTFPDFSNCTSPSCTPTVTEAKYVYDSAHLAVQAGSDPVQFKDRNSVTDMTHQYGMYDGVTGLDVLKIKSFGFPVKYTTTDGNGVTQTQYAYYGAWQGRHQLWANGGTVPAGTVVTRQDRNSNQTAETYTVSQPFVGTLVKRTPVTADINDLINIPVETWVNFNYNLLYDGSNWVNCPPGGMVFGNPNTCPTGTVISDFTFLEDNPLDTRKFININRWTNTGSIEYARLSAGDSRATSGAGFYQVTHDPTSGNLIIGAFYDASNLSNQPVSGDMLNANIGGSIYIAYNGTNWVQKKLISFDQSTWTPTFDPAGDTTYTLDPTREYYINNHGINYIVKVAQGGGFDVKIELQSVANPVNATTFVPAGTIFKQQWDNSGSASTFSFVTDSASANFLKLVYATVSTTDAAAGIAAGSVVTQGQWGLVAFDSGNNNIGQFNWDYPPPGQTFGTLNYLIDGTGAYKLLDDPIRLAPITLTNNAGQSKTLSLQFDGWMGGLPDLFQELQKNNFVMTTDISDKVINIPAGTLVTDQVDPAKSYLIKPLETSEFLNIVSDPGNLDLSLAANLDLSTVPTFVDPGVGAEPQVTGVKYSEGVLVQ